MIGPVVGARLSQMSQRLPFLVAGVMSVLNMLLLSTTMSETLLPSMRKPFRGLTGLNPLSFLALFNPNHRYNTETNGAVRRIASVLALQSCTSSLDDVRAVYASEALGWSAVEDGMVRSIEGLENICCGGLCGVMLSKLGPWLNTRVGNYMNLCAILGMGLSRSTPMLYVTQAPGAALVCAAATKSALACFADQVGVGQGELLAHTSSLMAVLKILGPLLYGWVFNATSGSRWNHAIFLVAAGSFALADLLMVSTIKDHELLVVGADSDLAESRPRGRYRWAAGLMLPSLGLAALTQVVPGR